METSSPAKQPLPSMPLRRAIDAICDEFAAAWRSGARPRIEAFVTRLPIANRPALVVELLHEELEARRRGGEQPLAAEYQARLPEFVAQINEVFLGETSGSPVNQTLPELREQRRVIALVQARLSLQAKAAPVTRGTATAVVARNTFSQAPLDAILPMAIDYAKRHASSPLVDEVALADETERVVNGLLAAFSPLRQGVLQHLLLGETAASVARLQQVTEQTVRATHELAMRLLKQS